ncbi:acyloxyacyl hydrolase [Burkholderia guangdongensis]|uniref:acyloxyacyl hydrolase n=1 Tax=Burkholderia guangdongensis TaxID=1792500 RepID=UPI0015CE0812|nr:acyloxyacyl hydrolase [Burkholderia guangdongensis]
MNNENRRRRGRLARRALLAAALFAASGAALADRWGIQAGGGFANRGITGGDVGVVWDPGWTGWALGGWHFAAALEGHVGYWHTREGDLHGNIGWIGAQPVLRFERSAGDIRPFIEGGAGVRVLSHPTIGTNFSVGTAFQFTELIGVGARFGDRQQYQAGFRFQHVSNAGIKEPNPGINFSEFYLQYDF